MPIWCRWPRQAAVRPRSFARESTGSSIAARMPMMAITTSNSIKVNARRVDTEVCSLPPAVPDLPLHFLEQRREFGLGLGGAVGKRRLLAHGPTLVFRLGLQGRGAV